MSNHDVVRFGPFAADFRIGELRKHGVRVRLHGQPVQVLGVLLERPGEVVTREELRARLWGSETFVDFEHGLNAAVNKLRAALNDSADRPTFIETVPRHGYRFIGVIEPSIDVVTVNGELGAPVQEPLVAPSIPQPAIALLPAQTTARRNLLRIPSTVIYAVVVLLVVVLIAAVWPRKTTRSSIGPADRFMLAVLPFENLSGDPDQEYFSDGLTEELITDLGQLDSARLGVIARTSVMGYKRTGRKIRDIGRELGVDYVLEGSVRRDDERIRISVQLIRAGDETHLWARSYDRALRDWLPVQTEIGRAIADELQLRLPGVEGAPSAGTQAGLDAHEAVLRGRYFLERRTADNLRKARESFDRALALEPSSALAYVGLADTEMLAITYADVPEKEGMARARQAVVTALGLDEGNPAAHVVLAVILTEGDWDWIGAEREFRRALDLDPNLADAHKRYAEHLSYLGRFEEAIAEARRARRLDPLSLVTNSLVGLVLYRARRFDEAFEDLQHAIELDANHPMAYLPQGLALSMLNRHEEAIAALEKGLAASDHSAEMMAQLALAYGRSGGAQQARAILGALQQRSRTQHVPQFSFALAYTGLGERAAAIDALEAAYRDREWYLCVLKTEPIFDPLRRDPRFQDLLQRLNFPP